MFRQSIGDPKFSPKVLNDFSTSFLILFRIGHLGLGMSPSHEFDWYTQKDTIKEVYFSSSEQLSINDI